MAAIGQNQAEQENPVLPETSSDFRGRCILLDHGRIVESQQYGKVFYVLFMDWEDMHLRYSDKFSE